MKVTVEVDGWSEEKFVSYVVQQVAAQFQAKLEKALDSAIEEKLQEAIERAADGRVDTEVKMVLAEGFKRTDEYGRELPRETLRDKVLEYLRKPDQYSHKTLIQQQIDHHHRRELNEMVAQEIAAAREKFRAEVDQVLKAKLGETLREALGIKA